MGLRDIRCAGALYFFAIRSTSAIRQKPKADELNKQTRRVPSARRRGRVDINGR